MAPQNQDDLPHLLSFDVEEYFQVEAASAIGRDQWCCYEKRLPATVDRILALLAEYEASATFFILGWVARNNRELIERIAASGCEIASHGMSHEMIGRLTPEQFRQDVTDSRKLLEDITSKPVIGYRAPTFSITHKTAWAIDVLKEAGYHYDSSIFPIHHDRYGVPDAPRFAHRAAGPGGGDLLEIPPLTLRLAGMNWPIGGGGYLRLFPVRFVGKALKSARRVGQSGMLYMHPWELDPDQPILPMSRLSRWRHRVGLGRTESKLRWLLRRFRFTDVRSQLDDFSAKADETYHYGREQ